MGLIVSAKFAVVKILIICTRILYLRRKILHLVQQDQDVVAQDLKRISLLMLMLNLLVEGHELCLLKRIGKSLKIPFV